MSFLLVLMFYVGSQTACAQGRRSSTNVALQSSITQSNNPFHLRDSWRSTFDSRISTGERFQDFSSISDMVYQLKASVRTDRRWDSGRRVKYRLDLSYDAYSKNTLASYGIVDAQVSFKSKSLNWITLDIHWIPGRVRKNYKSEENGVISFNRGRYSDFKMELSKRVRLAKPWNVEGAIGINRRGYSKSFSNRDRRGVQGSLTSVFSLSSHLHLTADLKIGRQNTSDAQEAGITMDRSFRSLIAGTTVDYSFGPNDLTFRTRTRSRSYLTPNDLDVSHFNRSDRLWDTRIRWRRSMSSRLKFWIQFQHTSNTSDRPTNLDSDSVPYAENSVGTGLYFKL